MKLWTLSSSDYEPEPAFAWSDGYGVLGYAVIFETWHSQRTPKIQAREMTMHYDMNEPAKMWNVEFRHEVDDDSVKTYVEERICR